MSPLPHYATLGLEQPSLRVLEWYLACVEPRDYQRIREELAAQRELVNPIEAFERIVRSSLPVATYKNALEYANECFPQREEMGREATRWMMRWEPELTRSITRTLVGEQCLDSHAQWSGEKHIAHALLSMQMMAANWENKRFIERWNQRLSYRSDITPERRQVAAAKAYWTLMSTVHPDWTGIVWNATLARTNPKHRASLEAALSASHSQMQQRAPTPLPALPELAGQGLVTSTRAQRPSAVAVE